MVTATKIATWFAEDRLRLSGSMPLEVLANTDDGIRGASSIMCLSEMDACEKAAVETTPMGKSAEIGGGTARRRSKKSHKHRILSHK